MLKQETALLPALFLVHHALTRPLLLALALLAWNAKEISLCRFSRDMLIYRKPIGVQRCTR